MCILLQWEVASGWLCTGTPVPKSQMENGEMEILETGPPKANT